MGRDGGHDIAAIDLEPDGYFIRCGCGWRGDAVHRDEVSALWWQHVLATDSESDEAEAG